MKLVVLLIASLMIPVSVFAQSETEVINPYGSGEGFLIQLTNSGFSLGAYLTRAISERGSFHLDTSIGAGKDEREARFFRFGSSFVPGKANYLLMMPVQAGFSQRLFSETIEDNFRPFVSFTTGPTVGWQYPYFSDCDGTGNLNDAFECPDGRTERVYSVFEALPKGEFRMGFGATFAFGAFFGDSESTTQGIRLGYSLNYFFEGVQLMERRIEETPRRFIGSPTITLTFGRLLTTRN